MSLDSIEIVCLSVFSNFRRSSLFHHSFIHSLLFASDQSFIIYDMEIESEVAGRGHACYDYAVAGER